MYVILAEKFKCGWIRPKKGLRTQQSIFNYWKAFVAARQNFQFEKVTPPLSFKKIPPLQLLKSWIFELEKELRQDQTLFNMQVHKLNTNGRPLPMTKFPCGMLYFEEMPESVQNEVVIVHNNFVIGIPKKIQVRLINVCKKVQRQCWRSLGLVNKVPKRF